MKGVFKMKRKLKLLSLVLILLLLLLPSPITTAELKAMRYVLVVMPTKVIIRN
jgi:hypothetical protein